VAKSIYFGKYSFNTGTIACVKAARRRAEKNIHHRGTEVTEESSLFFIAAERSAMKKQLACGCVNLAAGSVASAYGFSTHGDDVNIPIGVPQLPYRRWSTRGRAKTPNS